MKLDLQVSRRMTRSGEDNVVRLSNREKSRLKITGNKRLIITIHNGSKVPFEIASAHSEDVVADAGASWVSQHMFDLVVGNPTDPDVVTLGCDPEFVFLDANRRVLPANYWLPTKGSIGSDGPLAELRPAPAFDELGIVENLRQLIKSLPNMVEKNFGSSKLIIPEGHSCWDNYAIGFHIHLGAPRELVTHAMPGTKRFLSNFISGMDYFVGIPAMLLEDTNTRRLGDGTYGKPGDYRVSNRTVEYRTAGGFHLRHPEYSAGIMALALCYGKQALEDARQDSDSWRNSKLVTNYDWFRDKFSLPRRDSIRWALSEASKREAVCLLPELTKSLMALKYFNEHASSIRNYFKLVLENKQHNPRLLENW